MTMETEHESDTSVGTQGTANTVTGGVKELKLKRRLSGMSGAQWRKQVKESTEPQTMGDKRTEGEKRTRYESNLPEKAIKITRRSTKTYRHLQRDRKQTQDGADKQTPSGPLPRSEADGPDTKEIH